VVMENIKTSFMGRKSVLAHTQAIKHPKQIDWIISVGFEEVVAFSILGEWDNSLCEIL